MRVRDFIFMWGGGPTQNFTRNLGSIDFHQPRGYGITSTDLYTFKQV